MGLFNFKGKKESSGLFVPAGSGYRELVDAPLNASINDITRHLGYHMDQVQTFHDRNSGDTGIICAILEIFTTNIVFILAEKTVIRLDPDTVGSFMSNFSYADEYDSIQARNIFTDGIANKSLDIQFLSRVLQIEDPSPDGIHYIKRLGLYLFFIDGKLVSFQSADGLNEWAKRLNDLNPDLVRKYERVAQRHWKDDVSKVINEINIQANAWASTPDAFKNDYLPLHITEDGTVNFAMLLACHYQTELTLQDFKLINHGRYFRVRPNIFVCEKFVYEFNENNNLVKTTLLNDFT